MAADERNLNLDPITDEPGAHPVGTGIGATGGAVAGAAAGLAGGPIGAALGGVVGAVVGGLAGKGAIAAGKDADIVVFDPKRKFTISQKKLHQNVDYTPWEGWEMTGMPDVVFSRGKKVAEWAGDQVKFVGEAGRGKFVKRVPLAI